MSDGRQDNEVAFRQALSDRLTHEVLMRRWLAFDVTSETFCAGMSAPQKSLLEETLDTDVADFTTDSEQAGDESKAAKPDAWAQANHAAAEGVATAMPWTAFGPSIPTRCERPHLAGRVSRSGCGD